jgi:hypothetical protein
MPLESSFTYISDLVATNPAVGDNVSVGDDHIRGIKATILATFPNITGAITATHTELNFVDGVTSAVQTQIDNVASVTQNLDPAASGTTYTLDLTDANKHLFKNGTAAEAWTIPPNSSKAFPVGTTISLVNGAASGAITVTRGVGVALIWAGVGTDANRVLAAYGMATILKVATDTWYISGVGLS